MYRNYGDKDFFEYGILADSDHSDTEIDLLVCRPYPDEEDLYEFAHIVIDVTDTWIDMDAVCRCAGLTDAEAAGDPVRFAIACYECYGAQEFGADSLNVTFDWRRADRELISKELKRYLIAHDEVDID